MPHTEVLVALLDFISTDSDDEHAYAYIDNLRLVTLGRHGACS